MLASNLVAIGRAPENDTKGALASAKGNNLLCAGVKSGDCSGHSTAKCFPKKKNILKKKKKKKEKKRKENKIKENKKQNKKLFQCYFQ